MSELFVEKSEEKVSMNARNVDDERRKEKRFDNLRESILYIVSGERKKKPEKNSNTLQKSLKMTPQTAAQKHLVPFTSQRLQSMHSRAY